VSFDRQRRYRERNAAGGLIEVKVIVPADRADELRAYAAQLRAGRPPRAARRTTADPAQGALDLTPPDRPAPEAPPAHQRGAERGRPQGDEGRPGDRGRRRR
jgi:hypothetical protein